jgi:hypothetical protein
MKTCMKIRVTAAELDRDVHVIGGAEVLDISVVADDHDFGVDADGVLHVEFTSTFQGWSAL